MTHPSTLREPCEDRDSGGENRDRQRKIEGGACRRGEEARTFQQVGEVEILCHGQAESAEQEGHEGDGGNDGHGVQHLARQKRDSREGGDQQNDSQPLDGNPEGDELCHGHARLTSEHGKTLDGRVPRGELKGLHGGGEVDCRKCGEQDGGEG